jgi:hypothetical protein
MLETIMIINSTICFNCGVGITKWIYKVDTLEYQMAGRRHIIRQWFSDLKESKLYKGKCTIQIKYKVYIKQAVRENGKVLR